jgi:hypothetical protein
MARRCARFCRKTPATRGVYKGCVRGVCTNYLYSVDLDASRSTSGCILNYEYAARRRSIRIVLLHTVKEIALVIMQRMFFVDEVT